MADDSGSLSQDEIDALLNMGGDADSGGGGESGGGGDDLNLDSLLGGGGDAGGGGDDSGAGLDQAALDALTGAIGGSPAPSGGGGGGSSGGGAIRETGSRDNVDLLMDVTLRFSVELGRTQMFIKDVLMLTEGAVVELDKAVGDEVDILINDRLFGRGRLVILDEYFAVQITHILDPLTQFRALSG